jgi:hypothetical protein
LKFLLDFSASDSFNLFIAPANSLFRSITIQLTGFPALGCHANM